MTEVEALDRVTDRVIEGGETSLARMLTGVSWVNVARTREELRVILETLIRAYGPALTQAWLAWLRAVRPDGLPAFEPEAVPAQGGMGGIDRTVRYAAGLASAEGVGRAVRVVAGAMDRAIMAGPRQTMLAAVEADPAKPRYARVPRGPKTCAFCALMASYGFAWNSRSAAGGQIGSEYHVNCNCKVVPDWSGSGIRGYNPDRFAGLVARAEKAARKDGVGRPGQRDILRHMRIEGGSALTDGEGQERHSKPLRSSALEDLVQSFEEREQ